MRLTFRHYTTAFLAILALNLLGMYLGNPFIAAPTAALVLCGDAVAIGAATFPGRGNLHRCLGGLFLLACWFAVSGTVIYAVWDLSIFAVLFLWIATAGIAVALTRQSVPVAMIRLPRRPTMPPAIDVLLILGTLAALSGAIALLVAGRNVEATRSPWQTVSPLFFPLVAAATFAVIALLVRARTRSALLAATLLTFVAAAVALVVYGIGYGFDQFVHEKAIETILRDGFIVPKTPYYIGQYALVTLVARVSQLPHVPLARLITPLGYALLAPLVCAWTAAGIAPKSRWRLAALAPLLLPFTAYVATTPTGLAYLFALVAAGALVCWRGGTLPLAPAVMGALAALAVHPLVGIPALGLLLLALTPLGPPLTRGAAGEVRRQLIVPLRIIGAALIVFGVPAAFLLNAAVGGGLQLAFAGTLLDALRLLISSWPRFVPSGELGLDLAYLWRVALPLALAAAACLAYRRANLEWRRALQPLLIAVTLLIPAYLLLGFLRFPAAGDIGAATFPFRARLIELAAVFLLPVAGTGLVFAYERLEKNVASRLAASAVIAALVAATVYVSYPRVDRIEPSKGYAVSAATVTAVDRIESAARGAYVVLGNQTMAAAAIQRSGFKAYYKENFYYANESGAPILYDFFLKMNAAPTRETARAAMDAVGVTTVYFAVHDYWKDAPRIIAAATKTADDSFTVDGGKVMVFVYRR